MPTPELVTIRLQDTDTLHELETRRARTDEYIPFKDELATYIDASGGSCDRDMFLRSFWPESQRKAERYRGGIPAEASAAFTVAQVLQHKTGHLIAHIDTDEHPRLPRVKINSFGLILGTGNTESPVIHYSVEQFDDDGPSTETDAPADQSFFLGRAALRVLWTPNSDSARRRDDITRAALVEDISILEVERSMGEGDTEIVIAHASLEEMGLMVGVAKIIPTIRDHEHAAERIADQSQRALRHAALEMGFPFQSETNYVYLMGAGIKEQLYGRCAILKGRYGRAVISLF